MKRHNMKKLSALALKVDRKVNFRDDYDVPSMMEEIRQAGRILEPVHIRLEDSVVLKGNRRIEAAHQLLADPACPADLKKALESVDVIAYSELSEKELTELVLDHGSQKPLSRAEITKAVWRLQRQMYSERDIITLMYNQLARYTGNTKKAYEASQLPAGDPREKFLSTWLHGTVGNYLLAAGQMGEMVREQFLLNETRQDRELTEDETKLRKFETSRKRIGELASAKKKDKESTGWSPDKGGVAFNAKIEEFIKEDSSPKQPRGRGFSSEQMEATADSCQSDARLIYLKCAGKLPDGESPKLEAFDTECYRRDKVAAVLTANLERIASPEVKALIATILFRNEKDTEAALQPFLTKDNGQKS